MAPPTRRLLSWQAYLIVLSHALKFPHAPCCGFLIRRLGSATRKNEDDAARQKLPANSVLLDHAIPLFHTPSAYLSATFDLALQLVSSHPDMKIEGIYATTPVAPTLHHVGLPVIEVGPHTRLDVLDMDEAEKKHCVAKLLKGLGYMVLIDFDAGLEEPGEDWLDNQKLVDVLEAVIR